MTIGRSLFNPVRDRRVDVWQITGAGAPFRIAAG